MSDDETEYVELSVEAVEAALDELETVMESGETALSHPKVRPSVTATALSAQSAYRLLVEAHPEYELTEEGDG